MSKQLRRIIAVLTIGLFGCTSLAFASPQTEKQQSQPQQREEQKSDKQNTGTLSQSDRRFVIDAARAGMNEVEMGRLALERASNQQVKTFAQRMVDDHSKANSELMQLASTKGIALPQHMMDRHRTLQGTGTQPSGNVGEQTQQPHTQDTPKPADPQNPAQQQPDKPQTGAQPAGTQQDSMDKENKDHTAMMTRLQSATGADFDRQYMSHMVKDHNKAVKLFEQEASKGSDPDLKAWAAKTLPTLREHLQMARSIEAEVKGVEDAMNKNKPKDSTTTEKSKPPQSKPPRK